MSSSTETPRGGRLVAWANVLVVATYLGGCCAGVSPRGDGDAGRDDEPEPEPDGLCEILELGFKRWSVVPPNDRCHDEEPFPRPYEGFLQCGPDGPLRQYLSSSIEAGSLVVDVGRVEACRAAIQERNGPIRTNGDLSDAVEGAGETLEAIPECRDLFVGIRVEGESCDWVLDCEGDLLCELDLVSLESRCLPLAAEGEACSSSHRHCEEGLECFGSVCTARLASGQRCEREGLSCAEGLRCAAESCQPLPEIGEGCGTECAEGLYCDDSDRCAPLVASGERCEGRRACAAPCDVCRPEEPDGDRRCQPRGSAGDACLLQDHCRYGRYCDEAEGVCRPTPTLALGEACERGDDEACDDRVAFCSSSGRCVARGGAGAECTSWRHCREDLYCLDGTCIEGVEGDPCTVSSDCLSWVCLGAGREPGACAPAPVEGDPCGTDADCGVHLGCVDDACRTQADVGEPCAADAECTSGVCAAPQGRCAPGGGSPGGCSFDIGPLSKDLFTHWVLLSAFLLPRLAWGRRRRTARSRRPERRP